MGLEDVTRAVFQTAWNLPPAKLGRFLVGTVVPGEYARDVRRRHAQAQRLSDENTLRVLASVALWQRNSESPTCLPEAESVLRAFWVQSDVTLAKALDPHAAAVAKLLLSEGAGLAGLAPGPIGRATRELGARRQALTRTEDPTGRVTAHA
jgi:hypothetical protein